MNRNIDEGNAPKRRGGMIALSVVVGLIVLLLAGFLIDFLLNKDKVPRGAEVGGVSIGGMAKPDAAHTLERELGGIEQHPMTVHAGEMETSFVPREAGLAPDWAATVEAAGNQSFNPIDRIRGLFSTYEVDMVSQADENILHGASERIEGDLSREPEDGAVFLKDGRVETKDPINGQHLDRAALQDALRSQWVNPEGLSVEVEEVEPAITAKKVKDVAEGTAEKAVSAPVIAHGRDGIDGQLPPERMGEVVTFEPDNGDLHTRVNTEAAQGIFSEALATTEQKARNAEIAYTGGSRTITPHQDGVSIDWEKSLDGLEDRIVGGGDRDFEVAYEDDPAKFTTEMAEHATFDETIGEFTTGGYSGASGTNIAKVSETVNGAIIGPGETFSLNQFTGPRGAAQGYVESEVILDGRSDRAVGGGISQFATTLYNASYFSGMTDISHTPHSYYISRYPAGREATVYEGAIDLVFRNDSQYPVRIDSNAGGGSLTVSFKGVKTVEVESINGGRWAQTQPQPRSVPGDECRPSEGAPGFTTSDTRIVRNLQGGEISRNTTTTVYDPQPIIRCG